MPILNKNQKINVIVLGLIAFVVFPLFTAIFLSLENPILHSITEMGFDMGYYVPFLCWGIFIIIDLLYTMLLYLKESYFRKELKIAALATLVAVDIMFILTGACSDNPDVASPTVIKIHNKSAIAMFIGHFVVLAIVTVFSFFRNRTQGYINLVLMGFILITIAYCYIRVTDDEEFSLMHSATALCEGYAFALIIIYMYLNYLGNVLLAPTGKTILIVKEKTGKII